MYTNKTYTDVLSPIFTFFRYNKNRHLIIRSIRKQFRPNEDWKVEDGLSKVVPPETSHPYDIFLYDYLYDKSKPKAYHLVRLFREHVKRETQSFPISPVSISSPGGLTLAVKMLVSGLYTQRSTGQLNTLLTEDYVTSLLMLFVHLKSNKTLLLDVCGALEEYLTSDKSADYREFELYYFDVLLEKHQDNRYEHVRVYLNDLGNYHSADLPNGFKTFELYQLLKQTTEIPEHEVSNEANVLLKTFFELFGRTATVNPIPLINVLGETLR